MKELIGGKYSRKQIVNTINKWKRLLKEAKDESNNDSDSNDKEESDDDIEDGVSDDAWDDEKVSTSLGDFDLNARLARIHKIASDKVKNALGKFLLKQKAGDAESVIVTNSCVKKGKFEMPDDGKMYITVKVKLSKAQQTGFQKLVTLIKDNELPEEELNEGFLKDIYNGIVQTGKQMGKTAAEKLDKAHDRLKKNIGIESLKTYVNAFCGKNSHLADNVSMKTIAMNSDDDGTDDAELSFKCLIDIE